jgi:hypothetical protein
MIDGSVYLSPAHYVELGIIERVASIPKASAFKISNVQSKEALAMDPSAPNVRRIRVRLLTGNQKAPYFTQDMSCNFFHLLWKGLWAKCATYPAFAAKLNETGSRFLLYEGLDNIYGNGPRRLRGTPPSWEYWGMNWVGLFLMLQRKMIRFGWMGRTDISPTVVYLTYVKPIVDKMIELTGFSPAD